MMSACLTVFDLFVVSTMSTLKVGVTEKKGKCRNLQEQLKTLEKDTAGKLAEMDQYNKDMQVIIKYTKYNNSRITEHGIS